jgi:hypothetical protein
LKRARRGTYVQRGGHATHCMPRRRNDTTVQLSRRTIESSICLVPWARGRRASALLENRAYHTRSLSESCQLQA